MIKASFSNRHRARTCGTIDCQSDSYWLEKADSAIRYEGFAVIEGILDDDFLSRSLQAAWEAASAIEAVVGRDVLDQARREGTLELRLAMKYQPQFFELLAVPQMLEVIDSLLGPTALLRFQNLEILSPHTDGDQPLKQNSFHMNTQRVIPGYLASLDVVCSLSPICIDHTDILCVPGTHQRKETPDPDYMHWAAVPIRCPHGGMVVFDSTIWHAETMVRQTEDFTNSDLTRVFVVQQFTRSFINPHFDYVRALGRECLSTLSPRTRQLLGWETQLPTSLEEFYVPEEKRLYRPE